MGRPQRNDSRQDGVDGGDGIEYRFLFHTCASVTSHNIFEDSNDDM